ncbi:MAG: hypothetical protein QG597_662 [Actinomycetota bacterium]|nr:hypothetical protein [Actinomycetota bacterium]
MEFGDIARRCVYGTTGYLSDPQQLTGLELAIGHNLPILRQFRGVVVATNYGGEQRADLAAANARLWRAYLPDCVILDHRINRGHSIGTSDLDNLLFDHCRAVGHVWLCKGSNDVLLDAPMLRIPVVEADFYYLNAVAYSALVAAGIDPTQPEFGFFFPQTNFYAIKVAAADYLVDRELLDRSWAIVNRIPDYNGRIWEHIPGWSCERLLRLCVQRNGLSRCHLMSDEQFRRVLQVVIDQRIEDCSYKGLAINGICHLQSLINPTPVQVVN